MVKASRLMQCRLSLAAFLVAAAELVTGASAQTASFDTGDLLSLYQENRAKFANVRVRSSKRILRTEAYAELQQFEAKELIEQATSRSAKDLFSDKAIADAEKLVLENGELQSSETNECLDYQSDGVQWQLRFANRPTANGSSINVIPSERAHRDNLLSHFSNVTVSNLIPNGGRLKLTQWAGVVGDSGRGSVYFDVRPNVIVGELPPLAIFPMEWMGSHKWHPIDVFMSKEQFGVFGRRTTDKTLGAIDLFRDVDLQVPDAYANLGYANCRMINEHKVQIDPSRGCLPVSIEHRAAVWTGGRFYAWLSDKPSYSLKIEEIKEFSDGSFYPVRIVEKRFGHSADNLRELNRLTADQRTARIHTFMDARSSAGASLVLLSMTEWTIDEISKDIVREPLSFDFPEGTSYLDGNTRKTYLRGTLENEYDKLLEKLPTRNSHSVVGLLEVVIRWLLGFSCLVLVMLLIVLGIRKIRTINYSDRS